MAKLNLHPAMRARDDLVDWFAGRNEADRESSGFLPGFLAFVGSSLRYLDIVGFAAIESRSTLVVALMNCPSLGALAIAHRGWLWKGPVHVSDQNLPRLELLDLRVRGNFLQEVFNGPYIDHLRSSWSRLTALRVQADTQNQFRPSHDAIAAVLSHVTSLRYFNWLDTSGHVLVDRYLPRSYPQTHAWSSQLLSQLPWYDDNHLYVYDKSRRRRVAAFLSIGIIANRDLAILATAKKRIVLLAQLDRGIVSHIFQFVSSRVKRKITIEPKSEWLSKTPKCQSSDDEDEDGSLGR